MQTAGFAPLTPRLGYFTEAQLELGGLPISLPYLLITMFHGVSTVLPSAHITYLCVCSALS
jgi:hypothetical protein